MTFTITETQFYLAIILVLLVIQVYHQVQIKRLQGEIGRLWNQVTIMATALSLHLSASDSQQLDK